MRNENQFVELVFIPHSEFRTPNSAFSHSPIISERTRPLKLIVAIIRPEKLEEVQQALNQRDVYLMTVTDVRGCGRQRGYTEVYRGQEFRVRLLPKLKLEIAITDAFVEATVEAIVHAARMGDTGQIGDGKIFVLPLEDAVRIRTGERGSAAIGP